jgi:hypothetical protein
MSGPIYYQRMPDDDRPSWAGILVLACLALGLMAAMLELERSQSLSDRRYAKATATSYVVQQARLEDLGKNFADKNTQLIHLQSSQTGQCPAPPWLLTKPYTPATCFVMDSSLWIPAGNTKFGESPPAEPQPTSAM